MSDLRSISWKSQRRSLIRPTKRLAVLLFQSFDESVEICPQPSLRASFSDRVPSSAGRGRNRVVQLVWLVALESFRHEAVGSPLVGLSEPSIQLRLAMPPIRTPCCHVSSISSGHVLKDWRVQPCELHEPFLVVFATVQHRMDVLEVRLVFPQVGNDASTRRSASLNCRALPFVVEAVRLMYSANLVAHAFTVSRSTSKSR